jgi:hypothetical protein
MGCIKMLELVNLYHKFGKKVINNQKFISFNLFLLPNKFKIVRELVDNII